MRGRHDDDYGMPPESIIQGEGEYGFIIFLIIIVLYYLCPILIIIIQQLYENFKEWINKKRTKK